MCSVWCTHPQKRDLHTTRLKTYNGLLDGKLVQGNILDLVDRSAARYEVIGKIIDIAKNDDGCWIRLK